METVKNSRAYKLYVCGCRGSRPVHGARFEEFGGQTTWQEGCRLANELGTKKLVITHHDPANCDEKLREMEKKAKELCPVSVFARAGDVYEI